MAQDIGLLLRGLGAAVSNQVPQFRQQMMADQENQMRQQEFQAQQEQRMRQAEMQNMEIMQARQQAAFQDADAAIRLAAAGNYEAIIALAEDRMELDQRLGGPMKGDQTPMLANMARRAAMGDAEAARQLNFQLLGLVEQGRSRGVLQMPEAKKPIEVGGRLVDPETYAVLFEPPAGSQTDEYSPGITRYRNGVAVQYSRQGRRQVVDELGLVVEGRAAQDAIQRGIDSGVTEAGQVAVSQAQGKGATERAQAIINAGVDAIGQFPVLTRSLDLLDEVQTGGFAGAATRAKALFGIESADEGELSYNIGINVLQQLKPIFGGNFTASEGQRLENIEASLGRNTATNKRLMNQALDLSRTSAEKALDRAIELDDQATVRELEKALLFLDEWAIDLNVPEDWISGGGTVESWNRQPNEIKREFIRAQ
jgi:hypothetical protein